MNKYKRYYRKHKRLIWIAGGVIGFDLLPLDFLVAHARDMAAKAIYLSDLVRTLADNLNLTLKSVVTLAGAATGLWIWNKK